MMAQAQSISGVRLAEVLRGEVPIPPERDLLLQGLSMDSRTVHPGYLFLACCGHTQHGLKHLADARTHGAVAVVYDPDDALEYLPALREMPAFAVRSLGQHASSIAARFYGDPSATQQVVAVTGTNGKTSCSLITAQTLMDAGKPCGVLGTLGNGLYGKLETPTHTTPDAVNLQRWLARFRDHGVRYVSMEASSHALDQGRLGSVHVAVGVFTNLTRDHLDYHGSMAAYGDAKRRLFAMPGLGHAVINLDDAFGLELARTLPRNVRCIGYTLETAQAPMGKTLAAKVTPRPDGMGLDVSGDWGHGHMDARLLGRFNGQNLLAVLGVLLALEVPFPEALQAVSRAHTVPGRMECLGGGARQALVVVDYAHSPDALEKALGAARAHCRGQLWCVFGCGGERDRGKRPQMGAIAERLADRVVLTDDNPRHEEGGAIIAEILAGMKDRSRVQVQRERAQAVAGAVRAAVSGDVVLVAGKGHESCQIIGDRESPYSDRDTVAALLKELRP